MNVDLDSVPIEISQGELVTRYAEWGEMAIRYARLPAGTDMSPVLAGDRCPSPHWGIVLEGTIHLEHADGTTEKAEAGHAYHWPAGHTAWTTEPVAFLEVGPVAEMRQFSEHATAQFA